MRQKKKKGLGDFSECQDACVRGSDGEVDWFVWGWIFVFAVYLFFLAYR